jgi:hypothetical protein
MTAMISVKATTRQERLEAARTEWIQEATTYLFKLGVYAPDELEGANELAEILWDSSDNEDYFDDHANFMGAVDAVDEELTYWGD